MYEIGHTFSRTSQLFREKDGGVQKKTCTLELIQSTLDNKSTIGSVEIDMAQMVGKGRITQTFDLNNLSISGSPSITCAFNVVEIGENADNASLEKHLESM